MCGRFSLGTANLKAEYKLDQDTIIQPRYNIAPGTEVPVIVSQDGQNILKMMVWGFELKFGDQPTKLVINAMGETLAEKATFKKLIQNQRCLIPATGFYEWKSTPNGKIPHYIFLKEQKLFSFGGLFRLEKRGDQEILTCVIITTPPNSVMSQIHHRMPLILDKHMEEVWLKGSVEQAMQLSQPFQSSPMSVYTVSKRVNNASNQGEELIQEFRWELGRQ